MFAICIIFSLPVLKTSRHLINTVFGVLTFCITGNHQYVIDFRHEQYLMKCLLVLKEEDEFVIIYVISYYATTLID